MRPVRPAIRASDELRAIPGVRNFGAHIGRAEAADEVVGPNFAELWISVDPDAPSHLFRDGGREKTCGELAVLEGAAVAGDVDGGAVLGDHARQAAPCPPRRAL